MFAAALSLACLPAAAPPPEPTILELPSDVWRIPGEPEIPQTDGILFVKIHQPVLIPHPRLSDLTRPPFEEEPTPSLAPQVTEFDISSQDAAGLLSSPGVRTRANAAAIVQQRAALVERELVRQLAEAVKDPDPAATSEYHTLVAVAKSLRAPGAAPILVTRAAFAIDETTLPAGGSLGLRTPFYASAEALVAIGGRPTTDAVLDRLAGEWIGPAESRRLTRLPPADVYVLTWILQESLGNDLARASVAAQTEKMRRPDLLLARKLLEQDKKLFVSWLRPASLAAKVRQIDTMTDGGGE